MKNAPNSKVNLDRAIERFSGNSVRAAELRGLMANAIVAQMIGKPKVLEDLFESMALPSPNPIPAMRLEYQVAQKLHGVSAPGSRRAHDLIDLQLIMSNGDVDLRLAADLCKKLFTYRKVHSWPPKVIGGDEWAGIYLGQKNSLPVLSTADEAIAWANELIERIDKA